MGLGNLWRRLHFRAARSEMEAELRSEMQQHIEFLVADLIKQGKSPEEARQIALRRFGNPRSLGEESREAWGFPSFESFIQDLRFGVRLLARSPGFTLVAVLTLALGIGANTAIFSAVYALLIRPLPYQDPARLFEVTNHVPRIMNASAVVLPDVVYWRRAGRPFESVAAYGLDDMTLSAPGEPMRVPVASVTANFLGVLGVGTQQGRDFAEGEDRTAAPPRALLSDSLWRQRFSADSHVVGRSVDLNGRSYIIIGILPRNFRFPEAIASPEVLLPLEGGADAVFSPDSGVMMVTAIARLRGHATALQTTAELQALQEQRVREYPAGFGSMVSGATMELVPLQRRLAGDARTPLLVLLAAVTFVLLIACANIANLQLVRAVARRHEVAVRGALGAKPARLARQLLTESLVVSALAVVVGLGMGAGIIAAIHAWRSPALPWLNRVGLDPYVFGFTIAIAVSAALLFGTAPAMAASRADPIEALKATALRMSGAIDRRLLGNLFVAAEIALALMLLIGAGLLVRSFRQLMRVDLGYSSQSVLTARVMLPTYRFVPGDDQGRLAWFSDFVADLLPRLRALPGVRDVAVATSIPLQRYELTAGIRTPDMPPADPTRSQWPMVPRIGISADYFRVMKTSLIRGRYFTDADNENSPAVAIVNQTFAAQFFHGSPIGRHFQSMISMHCAGCVWHHSLQIEIVGMVADMRHDGVEHPAQAEWFVPIRQTAGNNFTIVVSTAENTPALSSPIRSAVREVNPETPVFAVATMQRLVDESLAQRRLTMLLLSSFAIVGLVLSAVGVYGVISYAVLRRTQEIGIRIALGSTRAGLLWLVLRQQLILIFFGSLIGLTSAIALSNVMSSLLFAVKPHDLSTFALSCVSLAIVAALASACPSLRATRTDPVVALRYE